MWLSNGFIITREVTSSYNGIDNDAWPLDYEDTNDVRIGQIHNKLVFNSELHNDSVALLTDIDELLYYKKKCLALQLPIRTLYCETEKSMPKFKQKLSDRFAVNSCFIGYYFADCLPDYHSCIKNELLYHPFIYNSKISNQLGKDGLFKEISSVNEFIKERTVLKDGENSRYFEKGDFTIYKLYNIDNLLFDEFNN